VKFLGISLIHHTPDPLTGHLLSTTERFRQVIDSAVLFEELGFDGFGIGERHHRPFISTAPPVVLSHIAALTTRVRLFSAVTLLSILDPVRVAEDYATVDHLSNGRLEVIIGKGNGPEQAELFGLTREQQWETTNENYRLLHRLWTEEHVSWSGPRRPPLDGVVTLPRPLQRPPRVWHGSATSEASVDLAAEFGDPLFSANVTNPIEPYAALVRYYRERWEHWGHDPADAYVGAGTAGFYSTPSSQEAIETYRPIFEARAAFGRQIGVEPVFTSIEDFVERSSALIGSPEQIIDKVHRYHLQLGHSVMHISSDPEGLTATQHRDSLELFQSSIAPELRRTIPDPPWPAVTSAATSTTKPATAPASAPARAQATV
jgi:alkanesulfonate monooxygenase SsuD/methylene tetrahydromethanopterin reductase-like flavin-dependent oxidoreductase (luciferase family)